MRTLEYARQRGHECRLAIGLSTTNLFERVVAYLKDKHSIIELLPVRKSSIFGSSAEVAPPDGFIYYDKNLDQHPADRLWVIVHELGHLELHEERLIHADIPDPVFGTGFASGGALALARYNPRSFQEAQANAFAAEFLFPSEELFAEWLSDQNATSASLATRFGFPTRMIRAQLAEGLYRFALGSDVPQPGQLDDKTEGRLPDKGQEEAATCKGKAAIVSAGPGTGKTATLVRRVENLLEEVGTSPLGILILTFSNEAAEELRLRIANKFDAKTADEIEIATFHGFGLSILLSYGHHLNILSDVSTLDETGQEELLLRVLGSSECSHLISLKDPVATAKETARHINRLKDHLITADDLQRRLETWKPSEKEQNRYLKAWQFLELFKEYEKEKRKSNYVDFADMLSLSVALLDEREDVRIFYREKYRHVLLDEYQDVSRAVAELLKRVCGDENLPWAVGDVRQAIYLFRGAARENVTEFDEDFKGALPLDLKHNYRSCPEIITAANQLATLMENPNHNSAEFIEHWVPGREIKSIGDTPIRIIKATSDHAESIAIAEQVKRWVKGGITPGNIAILCRRNVDVRNIMLSLSEAGIRATTAGLITPEGPAGDLAAVVTDTDRPGVSLPRIVYSLGRGRFPSVEINECIKTLLAHPKSEEDKSIVSSQHDLAGEFEHLSSILNAERHDGDAFEMMCAFLFDGSSYLRNILAKPDDAERSLKLSEILTSLGKAAGYRFTHPKADPATSRIGFGEFLRSALCSNTSAQIAPRPDPERVQVMTCHASKGLEFPCVIVAGQAQMPKSDDYDWLPPDLRPSPSQPSEQADALLFVGITRAQQAVVVTYADTRTGAEGSKQRTVTSLLERWQRIYGIETINAASEVMEREFISMSNIWGGKLPASLSAGALSKKNCLIRTYLEKYLGSNFPVLVESLYPIYIATVRRTLRKMIALANEGRASLSEQEAFEIFSSQWPETLFPDNPLSPLYRRLGFSAAKNFAEVFKPSQQSRESLELTLMPSDTDDSITLKLGLVAHYHDDDGTPVALTFRPKSLKDDLSKTKKSGYGVKWSALDIPQQIPLALLRRSEPDLRPLIFSTVDGAIYPFNWSTQPSSMDKVADDAIRQLKSLTAQTFEEIIDINKCNRCPSRISCPHWMNAIS